MIQISIRKNSGQDSRKSLEPARCFLSNLCPAFRAVAEGEHNPAVRIDCCEIHKPVEQLLVEIHRQFLRLAKPRKESAENVFAAVVLIKFPGGILIDQLPLLPQVYPRIFLPILFIPNKPAAVNKYNERKWPISRLLLSGSVFTILYNNKLCKRAAAISYLIAAFCCMMDMPIIAAARLKGYTDLFSSKILIVIFSIHIDSAVTPN